MIETNTHYNLKVVKKRFENAFATYDKNAKVQHQMADRLVMMMKNHVHQKDIDCLFEFGCGTGRITKKLLSQFNVSNYVANDLVEAAKCNLETVARKSGVRFFQFIGGDINSFSFPHLCNIICSGATVQWVKDIDLFFQKSAASLLPHGLLAFSTFGLGNFNEIRAITNEGLNYLSINDYLVKSTDWLKAEEIVEWKTTLNFNTPIEILQHIKLTGVGGTSNKGWTKGKLQRFCNDYESFRTSDGKYPLTYHPQILVLRKI